MSDLQGYYEVMEAKGWADPDPEVCLCEGRGWVLSDVDTWHSCPFHSDGKAHPEADPQEDAFWQAWQHDAPSPVTPIPADSIPF